MILTSSLLTRSFPTSIAYDQPIHAIVVLSFLTGVVLITISPFLPASFGSSPQSPHRDRNLLLEEAAASSFVDDNSKACQTFRPLLAGAVASLALRIELFRRILGATECTTSSIEVFIPLVLSLYDGLRLRKSQSSGDRNVPDQDVDQPTYGSSAPWYLNSRFPYLLPTLLVTLGCHLASGLWSAKSSTYICPQAVMKTGTVPLMQFVAAALDCHLAIVAYELCLQKRGRGEESEGSGLPAWEKSEARRLPAWGFILLAGPALWTVVGFIGSLVTAQYRDWSLPVRILFDLDHALAFWWQFLLVIALCLCSAHCMNFLGVHEVALTLMTTCIMISSISYLWAHQGPFLPEPRGAPLWSSILVIWGHLWFQHQRRSSKVAWHCKAPAYLVVFLLFLVALYPAFSRPNTVYVHPIEVLMHEAKSQHEHYIYSATQSNNMEGAAAEYRRRYRMPPPPAFDRWYVYSSTRGSIVMDQYDQIHQDMLPFWSIDPAQLRQSTWELISNPWNDIGGIKIRAGTATIYDNVPGTHRWMLEGVAGMINKFAEYLPDMDLALNLNDEARVAVPHGQIEELRKSARSAEDRSRQQSWSGKRADGWSPITEEPYTGTILRDMAFQNTFLDFGSVSCDPSSPARTTRDLYSHLHLCVTCTSPHSLGQFLSNWTLSADICHQPDMAHLHGFYLSPAAFRGSHDLVPIFSQSKPHSFNDILYPSAWNYMDKVVYAPTEPSGIPATKAYNPGHPDPPFKAKQNTLFWRGATSEGVSDGHHTWRGMNRQRFVHLANNLSSSAHETATILLPYNATDGGGYRYVNVPGNAIKDLGLSADVAIVNQIARCRGIDCTDQEAEFGLTGHVDFQSHWGYRYLFDLDGAGFSGRFLAFLQSRSLPFKAALFREWYDERMTAWYHFVPQDMRLHAVWSTLAYFAGVNGTMPNGARVEMEPHLEQAEAIAEQGREWAGKVLRKEDMEIYLFRVLLEWGRLTDDNRENMGFKPAEHHPLGDPLKPSRE